MPDNTLSIVLLTYDRFDYAERTVRELFHHFDYSLGPVRLHIADDGSPDGYVEALVAIAREEAGEPVQITASNAGRLGYGHSYNLATMATHIHSDLMLILEDDWVLTRPFNFDDMARALFTDREAAETDPRAIGSIRLGYIGFTAELRGHFRWTANHQYLVMDPESPERHVNSGHPRLETVDYERRVGPWREGIGTGATEFDWCGRPEARRNVAWPVDQMHGELFAHIGARLARED